MSEDVVDGLKKFSEAVNEDVADELEKFLKVVDKMEVCLAKDDGQCKLGVLKKTLLSCLEVIKIQNVLIEKMYHGREP